MNSQSVKKSRIGLSEGILLIIFTAIAIPAEIPAENYIILLGMGIWFLINFPNISKSTTSWLLILIVWLFLGAAITIVTDNTRFLKNYIYELLKMLFPFIVFMVLKNKYAELTRIRCFVRIMFVICNIYNLYLIITAKSAGVFRRTADSYAIIYSSVILAIITLFYIFGTTTKPKEKYVNICVFALLAACILASGYTIACICLVIGSVLVLLVANRNKRSIMRYLTLILFGVLTVLFFINYQTVLTWLAEKINNGIYTERINDVIKYINGNREYNTATARLDTYMVSINHALKHPIIGNIFYVSDATNVYTSIGYHSTILDNFGLFGLILGCIPLYLIVKPLNKEMKKTKFGKPLLWICTFLFLIIITFNNQIASLGILMYFYLMACSENISHKE